MADNTSRGNYPEPRVDSFISKATSRRLFIKGVIASGAAVSGAGYLFSLGGCSRQPGSAGGSTSWGRSAASARRGRSCRPLLS